MSSLVFIDAVRRNKHACHHCERTECSCNHITHNIAIIVLTSPDKSTFRFHDTRYCVVNQCIEILNSGSFEFLIIFFIINLLENIFKCMIVFFRDCIFCCKPQILFDIKRIVKTASRKTFNRSIQVVHPLCDSGSCVIMYQLSCLCSVFCRIYQLHFSRSRNDHLCIFIDISICMSCNCNWLFPVFHTWLNSLYNNRCTENCSV